MADKELRITSKSNDQGIKQFTRAIRELQNTVKSFDQTVGSLNKIFGKFGGELNKEIEGLKKFRGELSNTQNAIKNQGRIMRDYSQSIRAMNQATGSGNAIGGGRAGGGLAPGTQLLPLPGGGFMITPPGGGGGGAGGGTPGGGQTPQQQLTRLANMAKNIQYGTEFGGNLFGTVQNFKTAPYLNMAAVQGVQGQVYRNLLGGDISDVMALNMFRQQGLGLVNEAGGTKAGKAQSFFQSVGKVMGGVSGGGAGTTGAGGNAVLDALTFTGAGGDKAMEAQSMQTVMNAAKNIQPELFARLGLFQQMAPLLMQGNRRLGGKGLEAAGIGAGMGMMPGESIGLFTQLANQFGENVTMGGPERAFFGSKTRKQGGAGLARMATEFGRRGFDPSMIAQLIGGMGTATPGLSADATNRMTNAEKVLQNAIQVGVQKGIQDRQTLEALAQSIGSAVISGGTLQGATPYAHLLTAGLNTNNATPQLIQQRTAGLEALGAGFQNNAFLSVWSRQAAKQTLGTGASAFGVGALGGANPLDLLKPNAFLDTVLGKDADKIKAQQFQNDMQIMLKTVSGQSGMTAGPEVSRLQDIMGGKGFAGLAGGQEGSNLFAALLTQFGGFDQSQFKELSQGIRAMAEFSALPPDQQTPEAARQAFQGLNTRGGLAGASQAAAATAQISGLSDLLKDKNAVQQMTGIFSNMQQVMELSAKLPKGDQWDNATKFITELEKFVDKINQGTVKQVHNVLPPQTASGK